ncbi:MAG: hypothetical protein V1704_02960 [Candidatus Vogelbacteria bacterium]
MKKQILIALLLIGVSVPLMVRAQTPQMILTPQARATLIAQLRVRLADLQQQLFILIQQRQTLSVSPPRLPLITPPPLDFTGFLKSSIGRSINTEIVIDTDSFPSISNTELTDFLKIANDILVKKADTEIRLLKIRKISYRALSACTTNCFSPDREIFYQVYKTDPEPEFIIFFRPDNIAALSGGYAESYESLNNNYRNRFMSADNYSNRTGRIYIAVVDWNHMFSKCGYDSSDPQNPRHISNVSIGGECQNTPGTACIFKDGYYRCNVDESLNSPYAVPGVFVASTVIHELMHQFGGDWIYDHYGSTKCVMPTITPYAFEEFTGICPRVFENFKNSYQ